MDHHHSTASDISSDISGKEESSHQTTNVPNNQNDPDTEERLVIEDKNKYVPITNVSKIMRKAIPDRCRISEDAKETVQACVSGFINHITSVANQKCHSEYRKIITAEDLISAMESLGFDKYVGPLGIYLDKIRENDPNCKSSRRLSASKRHARLEIPMASLANPSPQFQGFAMGNDTGYYMGNATGGNEEGPSSNVEYDPYWQFK